MENSKTFEPKLGYVCSEILVYMNRGTADNAERLYPLLQSCSEPFILNAKFALLREMDVDGYYPFNQEYCSKFIGFVINSPDALWKIMLNACNVAFDAIKTCHGWKTEPEWLV